MWCKVQYENKLFQFYLETAGSTTLIPGDTLEVFLSVVFNPRMRFKACGVGWTNNYRNRPKGVVCTEVNFISSGQCKKYPSDEFFELPEGYACFQWPDRENNLCVGDFGGSIYAYENDSKGVLKYQQPMCIAVGSPVSNIFLDI